MDEVIKKSYIKIQDKSLLTETRVVWPEENTVKRLVFDQLGHCIVRSAKLELRVEPVIDETGEEVDAVFTGDVRITLQCVAWGQIKNKEGKSANEKNNQG